MTYLNSKSWENLIEIVAGTLSDSLKYAEIYHVDKIHAEKAIREFTHMKDKAALGDKAARQNIIDYYVRILESNEREKVNSLIEDAIDFVNICKNSASIIFELLLNNFTFEDIYRNYITFGDKKDEIESDALIKTAIYMARETGFLEKYTLRREKINFVCLILYSVSYGLSCIESLQYKDINEIGILNRNYIYVIYKGLKIHLKFLSFDNNGTIINIQKKTTQRSSLNYDMQNPILVTSKNNSNRISVAGYDVTPSEDDLYYNERIFNLSVLSLQDIKEKYETLDDNIIEFLKFNQAGRGSFIISGSDMGIGKSTFLLSMLGEYSDNLGIGILDPQNELQAGVKYPNKNIITLVENSKKNLAESFAYLLKTSRDVLVISEITLPNEVSELVNAALRLNAGVSATMHSFSPGDVVTNLRNLMMKTPMYKDRETAEEDIAGCIDIIIHLKRLDGGKIVIDSINEICTDEEEKNEIIQNLKNYTDSKEKLSKQLLKAKVYYYGRLIRGKNYKLMPIFEYINDSDAIWDSGGWQIKNAPSKKYMEKMKRYAGEDYVRRINNMFEKR